MKIFLPLLGVFFLLGCTHIHRSKIVIPVLKNNNITNSDNTAQISNVISNNLNSTILNLANQLFSSNTKGENLKIILTSFVDLNSFDTTSTLGKLVSESMFNELHIRNFSVTDFRGKETISVNEDGEFHISRDAKKLKDTLTNIEYVLVGTYSKFENQSLLINARIIDSISGNVISSARSIYQPRNCQTFNICENQDHIQKQNKFSYIYNTESDNKTDTTFEIISDDIRSK